MRSDITHLLILGCGYVGEKLAKACMKQGMQVIGTTRSEARAEALRALGIDAVVVESPETLSDALFASVDAVVDSIPLMRDESGIHAPQFQWLEFWGHNT